MTNEEKLAKLSRVTELRIAADKLVVEAEFKITLASSLNKEAQRLLVEIDPTIEYIIQ